MASQGNEQMKYASPNPIRVETEASHPGAVPARAPASPQADLWQLRVRLVATRARLLGIQFASGLTAFAVLLLGGLTVEMMLDWLVHLPWLARACFSLPAIVGAFWVLYRDGLRPIIHIPGDHKIACVIERALPVFETRFIAAVQLSRENATRQNGFVRALLRETAVIAAGQDFRKVVKTARLIRLLRIFSAVFLLSAACAWLAWADMPLLVERALLLTTRLPTRTRIERIDCPVKLAAGEDLLVSVQAGGVIPPNGVLTAQAGPRSSEYELEPAPGGRFSATIHGVTDSLILRVRLNDATSEPLTVSVFTPPAILTVHCVEQFPAYTKLPPAPHPTGDLSLLAGSTLHLTLAASTALRSGVVHLAGPGGDIPLTVDPATPAQASAAIPVRGLSGFSLHVTDVNGISSRETAQYPIEILPDHPPTIQITHPPAEDAATPAATEFIAFHAEDDFGVSKVFLHYVVNNGPEKLVGFDLGGAASRRVDRSFEWDLAALKLAPGGLVDYWLEAVDNNDVTGPGRGSTGHCKIKIVTAEEKRAELSERMDQSYGSLDQVSQSEEEAAKQLGAKIFQKPAPLHP